MSEFQTFRSGQNAIFRPNACSTMIEVGVKPGTGAGDVST